MRWFMTLILACLLVSALPVNAQSDTPEDDVLRIIEIGDITEDQEDKVREWLNSDRADNYPDLKQRAEAYIDSIEQDTEEANEGLSGTERVSDDVDITGYNFNSNNETVIFALELDESKNLVIQDMGAMAESGRFEWRSEEFNAGVHRIEMKAEETNIGGTYTQRIAIADTDAQIGTTIDNVKDGGSLFDNLEPWMIPLAGLSGALTVVLLIIRKVRKMDKKGVNDFIPLE